MDIEINKKSQTDKSAMHMFQSSLNISSDLHIKNEISRDKKLYPSSTKQSIKEMKFKGVHLANICTPMFSGTIM